ncbi:kynurenine 3-monooxygenase isoform X2 [Adelges cooleyi]|uniref:kynurenine 3-monooxygenase isoform X2 n=1 Tax=Adelges cooleyi TaxID=133065 RepID=UPI00217F97F9|nr:kynurenine 3-monooxygenase isoform X2 [Adelges cooleyi]
MHFMILSFSNYRQHQNGVPIYSESCHYWSWPDMRLTRTMSGRSINLALSERGIKALRFVGLDNIVIEELTTPMFGRMVHSNDGRLFSIPYDASQHKCLYSVSRKELNELLLTKLERYSNVSLKFSHKLTGVNFTDGSLSFEIFGNQKEIVKPDLVIGCDGAHSTVRSHMSRLPMFNYSQKYIDHGYMEIKLQPDASRSPLSPGHLHIWPRGTFMLIALPNKDKSWTCTLFMPMDEFSLIIEAGREKVLAFFIKNFKDFTELVGINDLIFQLTSGKPRPLISIKCDPYHYSDQFVLLGDAAHAMVPFFGQGMNAGFEDCTIFNQLLNEYDHDLKTVIKTFSKRRIIDAEAISDLAFYNYIEMRDLVARRTFLWRKKLDNLLYKWFPEIWIPLYNSVTFSSIPYSECKLHSQWQDKILFKVFIFLAVLLSFLLFLIISS